jgi:hypothetical protein
MYGKLNVTVEIPRCARAPAKSTMKSLVWGAPAPWPSTRVNGVAGAVAG